MSGLGCTVDIENERLANSLSNVRSRRPSTGEFDPLRLFGVDSVADIRPQISFQYERSDLGQAKVSIDGVELGVIGSYRAGTSALVLIREARTSSQPIPDLDLFGEAPTLVARHSNSGRPRVPLRTMIALLT